MNSEGVVEGYTKSIWNKILSQFLEKPESGVLDMKFLIPQMARKLMGED
jgi:hypothetical protein